MEKLVGTMKKVYFEWKLTEIIGKPKELWNNLKPYSKLWKILIAMLIILKMINSIDVNRVQGGGRGWQEFSPTNFSPVTSTNLRNNPHNF